MRTVSVQYNVAIRLGVRIWVGNEFMSGNINKPLLKVPSLNLNSIYRHSYLVPSASAGVPDPVVFHVGCGRAPVQQPHGHWRHLLQLRSRSGNTQLHTGTVACFIVQIICLWGGLPNPPPADPLDADPPPEADPPACRPPGCRTPLPPRQTLPHADPLDAEPPPPRQTLPHADPLDAEPPSPRDRPSRMQTPWMQNPPLRGRPSRRQTPGCRPPPPGGRPSPGSCGLWCMLGSQFPLHPEQSDTQV